MILWLNNESPRNKFGSIREKKHEDSLLQQITGTEVWSFEVQTINIMKRVIFQLPHIE